MFSLQRRNTFNTIKLTLKVKIIVCFWSYCQWCQLCTLTIYSKATWLHSWRPHEGSIALDFINTWAQRHRTQRHQGDRNKGNWEINTKTTITDNKTGTKMNKQNQHNLGTQQELNESGPAPWQSLLFAFVWCPAKTVLSHSLRLELVESWTILARKLQQSVKENAARNDRVLYFWTEKCCVFQKCSSFRDVFLQCRSSQWFTR